MGYDTISFKDTCGIDSPNTLTGWWSTVAESHGDFFEIAGLGG